MNGWQWNIKSKKCVPKDCEAPEPDCSDWEDSTQCCHHKPTPSKKAGNNGGYGTGYKRDESKARLREADQTTLRSDDVDATFSRSPRLTFPPHPNGRTSASILIARWIAVVDASPKELASTAAPSLE
ncbi:hypothetical protein QFC22_003514 [Naganishia vaughanmartiniae]|uniref:Uncharacterized protein n=1 Tax=Naganishia vaughanmartiniae TaxID=1424756 RepID=A0ACC2X6L9_9TREE|nr:hypothetical protein QFC22_003514 [Naganishia vaughanmartiniae]